MTSMAPLTRDLPFYSNVYFDLDEMRDDDIESLESEEDYVEEYIAEDDHEEHEDYDRVLDAINTSHAHISIFREIYDEWEGAIMFAWAGMWDTKARGISDGVYHSAWTTFKTQEEADEIDEKMKVISSGSWVHGGGFIFAVMGDDWVEVDW